MKILKARPSQTLSVKKQTTSNPMGVFRKNNHSIRKQLEAKGFAAIEGGTYVDNTINVRVAEETAERKSIIRKAAKPCFVVIQGCKGYFAFKGKSLGGNTGDVLLSDGKVFNVKALPLAKVAVVPPDQFIADISRRGKSRKVSFRAKGGTTEVVEGHVMYSNDANYGFVVANNGSVRNFEFKSNKYNQGKVAAFVK